MDNRAPAGGNSDEINSGNDGWRKSSYSMSNGQCVETARLVGGCVGIRDSMAAEGLVLRFNPETWTAFLTQLRTSPRFRA
jgi:uncharacterized protein DUF397